MLPSKQTLSLAAAAATAFTLQQWLLGPCVLAVFPAHLAMGMVRVLMAASS
jgi:hypothetical protein